MITPLLEGTDGVQKMSKSLGNYIGINEPAQEIFGKIMSISDEMMWRYYELCTDLTPADIQKLKATIDDGRNPRDIKVDLAKSVVADFHSREIAQQAEDEFVRRFRNKEVPDQIEEASLTADPAGWDLSQLLVSAGLTESKGEARRLIQQGGVSVDGEKQAVVNAHYSFEPGKSVLLKVGKRRFVRVTFTD